jgi:hypothetical protein
MAARKWFGQEIRCLTYPKSPSKLGKIKYCHNMTLFVDEGAFSDYN